MGKKYQRNDAPFQLSRSSMDEFLTCPRCFWLKRKMGISPPKGLPFTLNSAVDTLLKRECDAARALGRPTELTKTIEARPHVHPRLDEWRDFRQGVRYLHRETNIELYGAIDDLWVGMSTGAIHVVDYKATAASKPVVEMNRPHHMNYKRQVEVYNWLLQKNDVQMSDIAYFLYCTAGTGAEKFDLALRFKFAIIPHQCRTDWIEDELRWIRRCLDADEPPKSNQDCGMCEYVSRAGAAIPNP